MISPTAHLLITHGSRNLTATASAQALVQNLQPLLPNSPIFHAQLEGTEQPLHEQILGLVEQLRSQQIQHLTILPLFLIPGVHILEDLPEELSLTRSQLSTDFHLTQYPYLGEILSKQTDLFPLSELDRPTARILLSHGSNQPNSDRPILDLTQTLSQTLPTYRAYWSIEPSLPEQLDRLTQAGHSQIQILQYFLFSGTITEKLQALVNSYQQQNPHQTITSTATLDRLPTFLPLLAQLLTQPHHSL